MTALVAQHLGGGAPSCDEPAEAEHCRRLRSMPDTRPMSRSTRMTWRAVTSTRGCCWMTAAEVAASLVLGKAGKRLRRASHLTTGACPTTARPGHLDEAAPGGTEGADLLLRERAARGRRTRSGLSDVAAGRRAGTRAAPGCSWIEQHVLVHSTGWRSPARSGTCAAIPSGAAAEVGHRQQVVTERRDRAGRRPDEAAEHVEERRLAGTVRPDEPAACRPGT